MSAIVSVASQRESTGVIGQFDEAIDQGAALRFITCGSVDDGKSTLIGRLLVDSRAVLADQLASVHRNGAADLALLTDGLSAEREQGITIDVAWRYFATPARKFIIGDAPGHEQYTRNMVTAASQADCAVVLVDATKLDTAGSVVTLLPQTRRHALLAHLLRVPSIVFAVNKLDAVADAAVAYRRIAAALARFVADAGITARATVPVSALEGWNVTSRRAGWCGYDGPALLELLETLPVTPADTGEAFSFPVQWVEKAGASRGDTSRGRRVFWGRVATGVAQPGQRVQVRATSGAHQSAVIVQVLDHVRQPHAVRAGHGAGLVLDRELDISRGDWLLALAAADAEGGDGPATDDSWGDEPAAAAALTATRELSATVAWLDAEPLVPGRVYWALHGHRWVKARVRRIAHRLNIHTLAEEPAAQLEANAIGHAELQFQEPLATLPYARSRRLGAMILVDTATHATAAALLVR